MNTRRGRVLIVLLLALGLFAAACGDDSATSNATPEATEPPAPEPEPVLPGEGVTVTMARGNWIETNFQNFVGPYWKDTNSGVGVSSSTCSGVALGESSS